MSASSVTDTSVTDAFHADGFAVIPAVLLDEEGDALAKESSALFNHQQGNSRSRIGGVRNLMSRSSRVSELAHSSKLISLVEQLTGRRAFPVRAIFFDKTPTSNWKVPWHQDLTIAVKERIETEGFGPWSMKEGLCHVQPPVAILESMIAIRLHLDDCSEANGALRVIPRSHLKGELTSTEIAEMTSAGEVVTCEVSKNGALAMRPLLLHASSPATSPSHRRVLHIEYACDSLPSGLQWFEQ